METSSGVGATTYPGLRFSGASKYVLMRHKLVLPFEIADIINGMNCRGCRNRLKKAMAVNTRDILKVGERIAYVTMASTLAPTVAIAARNSFTAHNARNPNKDCISFLRTLCILSSVCSSHPLNLMPRMEFTISRINPSRASLSCCFRFWYLDCCPPTYPCKAIKNTRVDTPTML